MKIPHTLSVLAIAASLILPGCDKKPSGGAPAVVDEKTAIANFKAEVESVGKWIDEKQKTPPSDPVAGMAMMGEMFGKIKAIRTDGLPADLKAAWTEMGGVMAEVGDLLKGLPTGKTEKPEDAMKALGEIMPKMMAMQAKMEPIGKKLEEVGKKYGIDLSKVGPGK